MIGYAIVKFKAYVIFVTADASVSACRYSSKLEKESSLFQLPDDGVSAE